MTEGDYPLRKLEKTIKDAHRPLIAALHRLTAAVDKLRSAHEGETVTAREPDEVFDMETAIKASDAWECDTLHCVNCDLDQNLECLATYGILEEGDYQPNQLHAQIKLAVLLDGEEETADNVIHLPLALSGMRRPELMKLASSLGVKQSNRYKAEKLRQLIQEKR